MARRLAVLTTGRQDYGILRSTVHGLLQDPDFELRLWVGGMHLGDRFGSTAHLIEAECVPVSQVLDFVSEPPDPAQDATRAMTATTGAIRSDAPDALVLVGDRSETMAAAVAATILAVPIVHYHGGEETEGAIDNALRHAITKLSVLHFTTHELHARRVIQMGEDPASVHVVGPPGVDNLFRQDLPCRAELLSEIGLPDPAPAPLVAVTIHPTTLSMTGPLDEVRAVSRAMEQTQAGYVVTMPNADFGGAAIRDYWRSWTAGRPSVVVAESLGQRRYWGLLRSADLMVSNSSSGLIEAPAAFLPVVNVGDRQKGRLRHPLTIDVPPEADAIREGMARAADPSFREALRSAAPLFPPGPAWGRIRSVLREWAPPHPPRKRFRGLP